MHRAGDIGYLPNEKKAYKKKKSKSWKFTACMVSAKFCRNTMLLILMI